MDKDKAPQQQGGGTHGGSGVRQDAPQKPGQDTPQKPGQTPAPVWEQSEKGKDKSQQGGGGSQKPGQSGTGSQPEAGQRGGAGQSGGGQNR